MRTKFYDIRSTDTYKDAFGVYSLLPDGYKYRIENLISKEVYAAILFNQSAVRKIDDYCCKFFECKEKGLSYELGCYFQNKKYESGQHILNDIDRFKSLLSIYDRKKYPEESKLVEELISDLEEFKEKWVSFEKDYPYLFKNQTE